MLTKYHKDFEERVKTFAGNQAYQKTYDTIFGVLEPYDALFALLPLSYKITPIPYALTCVDTVIMLRLVIYSDEYFISNVIKLIMMTIGLFIVYNKFGKRLLFSHISQEKIDQSFDIFVDFAATYISLIAKLSIPQTALQIIKYYGVLFFAYLLSSGLSFKFIIISLYVLFHICAWFDFFVHDKEQINPEKIINDFKRVGDKVKESGAELVNKLKSNSPTEENVSKQEEEKAAAENVNAQNDDIAVSNVIPETGE